MSVTHAGKRKANTFNFIKRKKYIEREPEDDRKRAIEEWRREHEITRLEPGWSHYGWQS